MSEIARLQEAFQNAILTGDDAILSTILDSSRESRDVLFGVYRNAYASRLVDVLAAEFPTLKAFAGDDAFDAAARAYVAANPSSHRNARWIGLALPGFLSANEPYAAEPAWSEIAALECALSDAFDAADAEELTIASLAVIPPDAWADLRFTAIPAARRLDCRSNAFEIWSAVADGADAPQARALLELERLVVWRSELTPKLRVMPAEEAMLWDEAVAGQTFGMLCTMAATYDDPDGAAGRAAGYLVGWINAGMLSDAERG